MHPYTTAFTFYSSRYGQIFSLRCPVRYVQAIRRTLEKKFPVRYVQAILRTLEKKWMNELVLSKCIVNMHISRWRSLIMREPGMTSLLNIRL